MTARRTTRCGPTGSPWKSGGSVLLAHLGDDETGGLFRLRPDGTTETVICEELDGRKTAAVQLRDRRRLAADCA